MKAAKKSKVVKIGRREIGYNLPPFVIAEIGINHNGSVENAKKLIDAAVEAGCDAVKFQKRTVEVVYTSEELARPRPVDQSLITTARLRQKKYGYEVLDKKAWARLNKDPEDTTNGDLKRILEFGAPEYKDIDAYCKEKGIVWFASPWDEGSVDFLEKFKPVAYKIASASNTDKALLKYIKSKKRPIIISVGMSDDKMIDKMVDILGENGLIILHCVSTYPAKDEELHLANIPRLIKEYPKALIGYSGHEVGAYPPLVAAALGACVLERHMTLDRAMWGSDHAASLEIPGWQRLMDELRVLPKYLGKEVKEILESEKPIAARLRRKDTLFSYL